MTTAVVEPAPTLLLPDREESLYEVVNGKRVEPPPMGILESLIATALGIELGLFVRSHPQWWIAVETLFRLPIINRERRPDVAVVSYHSWPRNRPIPRSVAWAVVPELAVEVVSPSNTGDDVLLKMHEYFRAGVRCVWIVWPPVREVYVYESPTQVRVLPVGAELDGAPVLPDFRLPLATLFDIPVEEAANGTSSE